jgi:transcriptional regulator with XRE-family HTH domain
LGTGRNPRYLELAARLRSLRTKLGFTQATLAKQLGKPQSYISKLETCERRPDVIELMQICKVLEVPFEMLIPTEFQAILYQRKTAKTKVGR